MNIKRAFLVLLMLRGVASAQPISVGGLQRVVHTGAFYGLGNGNVPLDGRHDCSNGQTQIWNLGAVRWDCGNVGAITGSGTANTTTKWSGTSTLANGWALDDATTWGVSGKFTITEANGNTAVNGTLTADAGLRVFDTAGTGLTSSTNTVSLNINGGTSQNCAAGSATTGVNGTGIIACSTLATLGNSSGGGSTTAFFRGDGTWQTALVPANFTGTTNILPKRTGATTYGDSSITDDGTTVSTTEPVSISTSANSPLKISDTTQLTERWRLAGQEWLAAAHTSTDGVGVFLFMNRTNQRRAMFYDTAQGLAQSNSNFGLMMNVGSTDGTGFDSISTDATVAGTLYFQHQSNGPITLGGTTTVTPTTEGSLVGPGVFAARQVLSASSGTYTPTSNVRRAILYMCAAGGGGGGALGVTGTVAWGAGGGGGASGECFMKRFDPAALITGGAYANGTAGTAGTSTPGNGGTGGDDTIVIQGTTYTAKGGPGGIASTASSTAGSVIKAGGETNQAGSAGDATAGESGAPGIGIGGGAAAGSQIGGNGGSGWFGNGGIGNTSGSASKAGGGNGAGGAGASSTTTSGVAGGAGSAGLIIVDEYYLRMLPSGETPANDNTPRWQLPRINRAREFGIADFRAAM